VRVRRVIRWSLLSLLVLLALVVGAAALVLGSLDRPWVKRRVLALVQAKAGVEADWSGTRLRLLSGLHLSDLSVSSPPEFRSRAPSLLKVASLDVGWTLSSLSGNGPPLTSLRADGVELTMVRDENGRSSIDALGGTSSATRSDEPQPSPSPSRPLSHLLRDILKGSPVFLAADVERVSLQLVTPKAGYRLDGLSLQAAYGRDPGGWNVEAHLGRKEAPLTLQVTRSTGGAATVRLSAAARVTTGNAGLLLDAEVLEQTLLKGRPLKRLLHLEAESTFDPKTRKVAIAVKNSTAADGAATIDAAIEVPDNGPSLVGHAEGELDAARALELLPAGMVDAAVSGVSVGYRLENLLLDRQPRILPGGGLVVVGEADRLKTPALAARGIKLTVDGKPDKQGGVRLHTDLQLGSLDGLGLKVRGGGLTVEARELHVDTHEPLATRGHLTVSGHVEALDAAHKKSRVSVQQAKFTLGARLLGRPPYNIDADIPAGGLRLTSGARVLMDGPAHIELHASEVLPHATQPERSRGKVQLQASLGPVTLALTADKQPESVDYQLQAAATSLAPLRPFVADFQPAWERTSLRIASAGRVEQLFAALPRISHKSELSGERISFGDASLKELKLAASSSGNARKHAGELSFNIVKGVVGKSEIGDAGAKIGFDFDLPAARARLDVTTGGGGVKAALDFERARKAVRFDVDGKLAGLSALAPILGGTGLQELGKLEVGVTAKGTLLGVVADVAADGKVRLQAEPVKTLAVEGPVELSVRHLHWAKGDRELQVPEARWKLAFGFDGDRRSLHSSVAVPRLDYSAGDVEVAIHGLDDELETHIVGDLSLGVGSVDHRLSVSRIDQEIEAGYPIAGMSLDVHARRDADGVVHVAEFRLANQGAGTAIRLKGGFDVGGERRTMTLEGEMQQDLAKLWNEPRELSGRGLATLQLRVSSGNFRLFHGVGALRVGGADLKLPKSGFSVESMDGEIPLVADLVYDKKGLRLLRDTPLNAYSELRFGDQNPLLKRQSFITVTRLSTPLFTVGPLAGNLLIENNLFALSQFEAGLRGGRVTGQLIVDWRKNDTNVHMHLRGSNVQSSHGEPFDGNAAVELSLKDRAVEGRAEILRIGRRHLLDLLDLHDPHHGDPAANKVRRALALGYPDQVRLAFNHGFANAKVTFGGLARLVRIDELRGIPMGPIIDKLLAPLDEREEDDE
jgi:hypothetical protein